jgi:hypothetical protein
MTKYYKFLTKCHRGPFSDFDYTEYLPKDDRPGLALPLIDKQSLVLCSVGYHACTKEYLLDWPNTTLWQVEFSGQPIGDFNKVVGCQIRFVKQIKTWNERTVRLFAVEIARMLLSRVGTPDAYVVNIVNMAEKCANGGIDYAALLSLAGTVALTVNLHGDHCNELIVRGVTARPPYYAEVARLAFFGGGGYSKCADILCKMLEIE